MVLVGLGLELGLVLELGLDLELGLGLGLGFELGLALALVLVLALALGLGFEVEVGLVGGGWETGEVGLGFFSSSLIFFGLGFKIEESLRKMERTGREASGILVAVRVDKALAKLGRLLRRGEDE